MYFLLQVFCEFDWELDELEVWIHFMVLLNLPGVSQFRNYYPSSAHNSHFLSIGIILQEINYILLFIFTIIVVDSK
jgi:hypothetical protein